MRKIRIEALFFAILSVMISFNPFENHCIDDFSKKHVKVKEKKQFCLLK